MEEAWQVREYQRQKLVEKLIKNAWDYKEENDLSNTFYFDLAISITGYLKERISRVNADPMLATQPLAISVFLYSSYVQIKEFSRTPEEYNFLLGKFLSQVIKSVLQPFNSEMLRQEVHEPVKIYGAPAMAKIPIPNDTE